MKVKIATKFKDRFMGLMFKNDIKECIIFPKCNSIHTFFMKEPIDIVMTDKNKNILYSYENFKPKRIILPKKNVYYTYEFPKGSIKSKLIYDIIKKEL